jgi:hypothetical protein
MNKFRIFCCKRNFTILNVKTLGLRFEFDLAGDCVRFTQGIAAPLNTMMAN